jgi:hypothetical protein
MDAEEQLLQQIRDALDMRKQIKEGTIILLDSEKAVKAFDLMTKAKVDHPIKPRWTENHKLWILVGIATWGMVLAVALSIWR